MVLRILTPDLNGDNLENQNKMNKELYERTEVVDLIEQDDFKDDIGKYVNVTNNYAESNDLFNKPPKGVSYDDFAQSVDDDYYGGITANNKVSQGEIITIKAGEYFFYSVKTEKFNKNTFSFFVQVLKKDESSKIEYRLLDEATPYPTLRDIEVFNETYDIYGALGQSVKKGQTIQIRFDNRNASGDLVIKKPVLFEGSQVSSSNTGLGELTYKVNSIQNELEQMVDKTNKDTSNTPSNDLQNYQVYKAPVYTPDDFTPKNHPLKGLIYTDGHGRFLARYDVAQNKLSGAKTFYVDYNNGNDDNEGRSKDMALKTFDKAFSYANANDTIIACEGYHYRSGGGVIPKDFNKSVNIIGENNNVHLIIGDEPVWSKTNGRDNVYQTPRTAADSVIDLVKNKKLNSLNSIDEVSNQPNSWYTAEGIVYVNVGEKPDKKIVPLLGANHIQASSLESDIYMENLKVYGGKNGIEFTLKANNNAYLKNVKSFHSTANYNGVAISGGSTIILQDCEGSFNSYDGLNYHKGSDGSIPLVIEINCKGIENGSDKGQAGAKSNNGSTVHDGISIIRINGVYARNDGGNVADVNEGTKSWNLGTVAFESYQGKDFQTASGSDMWLDNCVAYGSDNSINSSDEASTIYTRFGNYQNKLIIGKEIQY